MRRDILDSFEHWSKKSTRVPLIVKGARQVGKSWSIREFGQSFKYFVELNFEKHQVIKEAFTGDIDIHKLLERISLYTKTPIIPGETLLFLDELQECPAAISYLRYFKEELPDLHVIVAGSLIEFALDKVGMPVGRVEYLYLTPLSFGEYLTASGRTDLRNQSLNKGKDPIVDSLLKEYLRTYMWLGGMPEVVSTWLLAQDAMACQAVQQRIITAYLDDFPKYAKHHQIEHVDKVFKDLPLQLGKKFKFSHIDPEIRANPLKVALNLLQKAGVAYKCHHTSGQNPPLMAAMNEKFFKAFLLDIGLAQRLMQLEHTDWIMQALNVENLGEITEQFVAQELIAYLSHDTKAEIFYWHREAKSSMAEIDFLISQRGRLLPIEVKSGKTGRLKSLHLYLESHQNAAYGTKVSEAMYQRDSDVLSVPLYGIEKWLEEA